MNAYQLFQATKPSLVQDIFMWMRDTDRNLYKTALSSLATNRKLRTSYIQKKPVTEQIEWMHKTLQLKTSDMIGEHLLQVYFMKGQEEMLAAFCDGLEIAHSLRNTTPHSSPSTSTPSTSRPPTAGPHSLTSSPTTSDSP